MTDDVRKGQAPDHLPRAEFGVRFHNAFRDPAFEAESEALGRLEEIAWKAYSEGRKAPRTRKAGPGYADPDYDLSLDWIEAKERIDKAHATWADPASRSRVLVICGAARNDGTCPGEISKTFRLTRLVCEEVEKADMAVDRLDLSLLTSEYGRHIHPCKGCVSTAMPLCHWPCSCYPNHAERQTGDWMNEIYEMWVRALETRTGGIVGASGSCYAIRSHLHRIPVRDDLSRDFSAALTAEANGYRAVSVDESICYVPRTGSLQREFRRKVRACHRAS
jgi:hypothetical protein